MPGLSREIALANGCVCEKILSLYTLTIEYMKKIFLIFAFFAFMTSTANAQVRFGITGGPVWDDLQFKSDDNDKHFEAETGFEAGLTLRLPMGYGFSIQPAVMFAQKAAKAEVSVLNLPVFSSEYKMSNIEIPIHLQWGYQFDESLNLRPFIQFGPYFGYAVARKFTLGKEKYDLSDDEGFKKFDWGLSGGFGLDIWKLQLMCRYNWGLGNVFEYHDFGTSTGNFKGFRISAAFWF